MTDERLGRLTKKAGRFAWKVFIAVPVIPTLARLAESELGWWADKLPLSVAYIVFSWLMWGLWDEGR